MNCVDWHAGFVLTTVEAIGDITATEEASALATFGDKHNRRVQGGLLGDGQYLGHIIALFNAEASVVIQKRHPYTGSVTSEMSRHSKHMFLFCEEVLTLHTMQVAGVSEHAGTQINAATVTAQSHERC